MMSNQEIYVVKKKRAITAEQQQVCDVCKEPATMGCTDATETPKGWTQSAMRYGCEQHPVVSRIEYLNADKKTNC